MNQVKKNILETLISHTTELSLVEELIRSKFNSEAYLLREIPEYLLSLGGKRIRPILNLLCFKAIGEKVASKDIISISAGIELIHMATLLHDDIIDKSDLRRHQESAFRKYGLASTLLSGDFLLVRAFSLCSTLPPEIIKKTEEACVALTEGEILETPLFSTKHTIESSLDIAKKKTAALFSLAGFSAGFLSKKSDNCCQNLFSFGENIGIAFQILDDILDITSTKEKLGKPPGIDIRERKPSIVNILWLKTGSNSSKTLLTETDISDQTVLDSIDEIKKSGVIKEAKELARDYAIKAKNQFNKAIEEVESPDQNSISLIDSLIEYTLERLV